MSKKVCSEYNPFLDSVLYGYYGYAIQQTENKRAVNLIISIYVHVLFNLPILIIFPFLDALYKKQF